MGLPLDKRTACSGWYIMNGLEGGRKGQRVFFFAKACIYYFLTSFLLLFVYTGSQNRKLFTKYMIELNVHLLVADGIERLFVGGILLKHSSSSSV